VAEISFTNNDNRFIIFAYTTDIYIDALLREKDLDVVCLKLFMHTAR